MYVYLYVYVSVSIEENIRYLFSLSIFRIGTDDSNELRCSLITNSKDDISTKALYNTGLII